MARPRVSLRSALTARPRTPNRFDSIAMSVHQRGLRQSLPLKHLEHLAPPAKSDQWSEVADAEERPATVADVARVGAVPDTAKLASSTGSVRTRRRCPCEGVTSIRSRYSPKVWTLPSRCPPTACPRGTSKRSIARHRPPLQRHRSPGLWRAQSRPRPASVAQELSLTGAVRHAAPVHGASPWRARITGGREACRFPKARGDDALPTFLGLRASGGANTASHTRS